VRLAVVAGGWHWPAHFFQQAARIFSGADLFVVAHRNPELKIVREEKREVLASVTGPLGALDRELYSAFPSIPDLLRLNWTYEEAPNTVGDWGFFNQWLDRHDFRKYDVILNCHDDTYLRGPAFPLDGDWLILGNGTYPQAPDAYVRGSFEFWKREMLEMIGGRIDLGEIPFTREGLTDTPQGIEPLLRWNDTALPLRRMMNDRGLSSRIKFLSPYYRVSPFAIEGERGFMHSRVGVPWSYDEGLKAYPLEVAA
jgi:hypothetical protein